MRATTPAVLSLLLAPALASANGGPVGGNGPSAMGGVQPVLEREVRLLSEDLTLTLGDDGNSYRAEAHYVLANPTASREVAFGVPVSFFGGEAVGEVPEPKQLAALARGIRIEVAGQRVACAVASGAKPAASAAPVPPVAGEQEQYLDVAAWCVARVRIPVGDAVPLTLGYEGALTFEDWETSKSALRAYEARRLRYALFPAGYWAGKPDRVRIRLETGRFEGLATAKPPPTRKEGAALVWDLEAPDLTALGSLLVRVDVEPVLRHRELLSLQGGGTTLGGARALRATSSSALAPQGKAAYGAERAVDGDGATAWCEGKPGDGVGEWIEVRLVSLSRDGKESPPAEGCPNLEGLALVPGYAKSQGAWVGNGRVRAFRLGPCGGTGGTEIRLAPGGDPVSRGEGKAALRLSSRHDRSALLVPLEPEDPYCVRLTILEVERGATQDTCISELRPVFNCG